MQIQIIADRHRLCRWHHWLASELAGLEGVRVGLRVEPDAAPLPASVKLLLLLEGLIAGGGGEHALDPIATRELSVFLRSSGFKSSGSTDLVIDLTGQSPHDAKGPRRLVPLFDGASGENAFWLALLERRAPMLSIQDSGSAQPVAIGLPGLESSHILSAGADTVLSRLVGGLVSATRAILDGRAPAAAGVAAKATGTASGTLAALSARFAARRLHDSARRALDGLLSAAPQWSVAWRAAPERRAPASLTLNLGDFTPLKDDGQRYYADPFVVHHGGIDHVFVEEFPYATRKGIISHFTIGADGRASPPRPVLERLHHLSYPQVFARDGQMWMLPEASASGGLELYRADPFPDRWVLHARLIDGPLADATLLEHGGRLWLFATIQTLRSSTWDGLGLFHADWLDGPWVRHPLNPVLIDVRSARPAGMTFVHGGDLIRPAQDCACGYGSALTLARITKLDPENFAQETVARLNFAPASGVRGPHTLNWAAGIEAVDLFAKPGP